MQKQSGSDHTKTGLPEPKFSKMNVMIRGRKWELSFVDRLPDGAYGECDDPSRPNKCIRVAMNMSEEEFLETTIHECTHACVPDLSEEAVEILARDIAHILYRIGFRIA